MKVKLLLESLLFILCLSHSMAVQATNIIDFEGLPDSTQVDTQYSGFGIAFNGVTILTAGISLNEFDFPPFSGTNVVTNDYSPIIINFNPFVTMSGAYFTYVAPVTITAYDSLNNVVGSVSSLYSENYVSSVTPFPNEFLSINYIPGISKLEILGDPLGSSLVIDDFTFETASVPIPEPATFILLGSGLVGLMTYIYRKNKKSQS